MTAQRNPDGSVFLPEAGILLTRDQVAAILAVCAPGAVASQQASAHLARHGKLKG